MTVSLKHAFQSAKADGADTSIVRPSDWNAEHVLTQATGKLLGRTSAGTGATEEISAGSGLTLGAGTLSADVTATGSGASGTWPISISGNAATATKWVNGRTISLTGDVTYTSGSFDGSANVTGTATLSNSGVTAGSYTYASVTVDAKGRITSASSGSSPIVLASGTAMLFAQTSAPTGWTKSTTHDNKALRVVSGTASSGGSVAFTTAFASQAVSGTVGNTTLSTNEIPSHQHGVYVHAGYVGGTTQGAGGGDNATLVWSSITSPTGGGAAHNHSFSGTAINLAVQYVDVIIATKD